MIRPVFPKELLWSDILKHILTCTPQISPPTAPMLPVPRRDSLEGSIYCLDMSYTFCAFSVSSDGGGLPSAFSSFHFLSFKVYTKFHMFHEAFPYNFN